MKPLDKGLAFILVALLASQAGTFRGCEFPIDVVPQEPPIAVDGLAVLVVYESSKVGDLPKEQSAILTGTEWREVVTNAGGQFRVFDVDTDFVDSTSPYKAAIDKGGDIPRVVISNKGGYTGPLPADNAAMVALVKEWIK